MTGHTPQHGRGAGCAARANEPQAGPRRHKLAIALLIDAPGLYEWESQLLQSLSESNDVDRVRLLLHQGARSVAPPSLPSRFLDRLESIVIDRSPVVENAFMVGNPAPEALIDHESVPEQATDTNTCGTTAAGSQPFDIIVDCRHIDSHATLAGMARFGIWRIRSGMQDYCTGKSIGYFEVLTSAAETNSFLTYSLAPAEDERVIRRSSSSTQQYSVTDNASTVMWKSLHFVTDAVSEAARNPERFLETSGERAFPGGELPSAFHPPGYLRRLVLLAGKALTMIRRKYEDLFFFDQWRIAYRFAPDLEPESMDLSGYQELVPPKNRVWADPFPLKHGGQYYVFIEECYSINSPGHISFLTISADGRVSDARRIIQRPYHLSYPYLFEYGGNLYMVPESSEARTVELYRCTGFPDRWEHEKNLLENIYLVDCSIFEWEGRWWMMANGLRDHRASPWDELFVFFADSPLSDSWTPHPCNPVVSDVSTSRPAGRVFRRGGRILRPSQDSAVRYGHGLNIMEITELTPHSFRERLLRRYTPDWDPRIRAVHTVNAADGLSLIDTQRLMRKSPKFDFSWNQGHRSNEASNT